MARNYNKTGSAKWNRFLRIVLVVLVILLVLFYVKSLLTPADGTADPGGIDLPITDNTGNGESSGAPDATPGGSDATPGGTDVTPGGSEVNPGGNETAAIDENGTYTSKEDVALYIYTYGRLPSNFITKKEAQKLGWEGGSLEPYAPGKSIGGDRFGNYEGLLPKGKTYTECDIDTKGKKSRGAKRIVFSNDGLIYYTGDHYETFELLYGEE